MDSNQEKEYQSFMKWFEMKYPQLHQQHRHCISTPMGIEGVTVKGKDLHTETYNMLVSITNEYYRGEYS